MCHPIILAKLSAEFGPEHEFLQNSLLHQIFSSLETSPSPSHGPSGQEQEVTDAYMQVRASYTTEASTKVACPSPSTCAVLLGMGSITAGAEVAVACRVLMAFPALHPSPTSCSHRAACRAAAQPSRSLPVHAMVSCFHPCTCVPMAVPLISPPEGNWPAKPSNSH